MSKHYLCEYESHRALKEFDTSQEVIDYINDCGHPYLFCHITRYGLAKEGLYPRNKIGNNLLKSDISKKYFIVESKFPVLIYE